MSWMISYPDLDEDQKDFVDNQVNKDGNIWVQGFAGSGKSVLLIHALRVKLRDTLGAKCCIVVFTHSLRDMFSTGINELDPGNNEGLKNVPVITYHEFMKNSENYDYIFCDEVQDIPAHVLAAMKNRSKHVIVAGDSNQSIYANTVNPSEIGTIISARAFILNRVYRLTRSIMAAVSKMMPNLDIFGARRDMTKVDVQIRLRKCKDLQDEVKYTYDIALENAAEGDTSVILLPFHDDIKYYIKTLCEQYGLTDFTIPNNQHGKPDYNYVNRFLNEHNIKLEYVGNNYGSFQNAEKNRKVVMMTYHSSKGMDFRHVFLPFMNYGTRISASPEISDETLFMVALTRSNRNLYLTYSSTLHPLVEKFKDVCSEISDGSLNQKESGTIFGW